MEFVCRHCDKLEKGPPYRVTSEEAGVILLDMIVCRSCSEQAKRLGLKAEEINQAAYRTPSKHAER
jgi:hypothetical protein